MRDSSEDRRCENIVNTRHALQITLLLYDFYISLTSSLSLRAHSNSLVASTFWYLVVFS